MSRFDVSNIEGSRKRSRTPTKSVLTLHSNEDQREKKAKKQKELEIEHVSSDDEIIYDDDLKQLR